MRVFLAHSSAQQEECAKLVTKLRARGFKVFYSDDSVQASESFDRVIRAEVARCDAMIFLLSKQSIKQGCYALTELGFARERWPNPRRRVLAVVMDDVPVAQVPVYLRDNIELLRPHGDAATETAEAMTAISRARRRAIGSKAIAVLLLISVIVIGAVWHARLRKQARFRAVETGLLDAARNATIYTDTCATPLNSFADYVHPYTAPTQTCNSQRVVQSLSLPALVVSQTGYGKKGFLQSVRGDLARKGRPSVLVSYRDCVRGRPRNAPVDVSACVAQKASEETHVSVADASEWLGDGRRYVLMFDAIDDSGSREHVFRLIRSLWQHQQRGGTVVLSSQPENLKFVLTRFGLEEWMTWVQKDLPTVDVRGVNMSSVRRVASEYEEHQVPAENITTILDFPQRCPESRAVLKEWIAQPKLFRDRGNHTVRPVVDEILALGDRCSGWRGKVLEGMWRARFWSYCHDELCDYQADGARYIRVAKRWRDISVVGEAELADAARSGGFDSIDGLAFPLLSTGILYVVDGKVHVDPQWIPD